MIIVSGNEWDSSGWTWVVAGVDDKKIDLRVDWDSLVGWMIRGIELRVGGVLFYEGKGWTGLVAGVDGRRIDGMKGGWGRCWEWMIRGMK